MEVHTEERTSGEFARPRPAFTIYTDLMFYVLLTQEARRISMSHNTYILHRGLHLTAPAMLYMTTHTQAW